MFMHSHACVLSFQYILIYLNYLRLFWLSLFLSLFFCLRLVVSMAPKRKSTPSQNPLRSGASSSSDPTPSHLRFRDENAQKDFSENFSRRGVHSECRVILADFADTDLPTIIHSRGWESLCDVPVTCPTVLIQEFYSNMHGFDFSVPFFSTRVRGTHIIVTSQLIADVLHVPRVEHPDYPGYKRLRIVSKDEMISAFYERPTDWGDRQFTPCKAFAKGPRFINMVITFVLHPLSYYNYHKALCSIFAFFIRAPHYRFSFTFHSFYLRCV